MGIDGLWNLIQAAEQITAIQDLAVMEGYQRNTRGHHTIIIGVDTDAIMAQCIGAAHAQGHVHGPGHLQIFFYKLCKFLRSPVTWVFAFDGPERPTMKRGKTVPASTTPSWVGPCKLLIECFGFHIHQAPGEADAELAQLNAHGLIDVIITTDSDVFVFGALAVLRSTTIKTKPTENKDEVGLYTADAIEAIEGLTLGGHLLMALMVGGDYSSGLEGCGEKTAHGLAKCGFGDSLLTAVNTLNGDNLHLFLTSWVDRIRDELHSNAHGFLPSRRPQLAASISSCNFLSPPIIDFYVWPVTSFNFFDPGQALSTAWKPGEIRINRLASFCASHLGWREATTLRKIFHSNVWEGVFIQMLISPWVVYSPQSRIMRTDNMTTTIHELQPKDRQCHQSSIKFWYRTRISTETFIDMMGLTCEISPGDDDQLNVWAPMVFFPPSVVPVKQARKRWLTTAKNRLGGTKKGIGKMKAASLRPIPDRTSPVRKLPLFVPIPMAPRRLRPSPAIEAQAAGPSLESLDRECRAETDIPRLRETRRFLGNIDLTADADETQAEASSATVGTPCRNPTNAMSVDAAQWQKGDNEPEVIYISD